MSKTDSLRSLTAGSAVVFGGSNVSYVSDELAARFRPGDELAVVDETGELLLVPAAERGLVSAMVADAVTAFAAMESVRDQDITSFFEGCARNLEREDVWRAVVAVNEAEVASARQRGRSTTRLVADDRMRLGLIEGLRQWRDASSRRDRVLQTIDHGSWTVELRGAALGVVGFVFEGRPNVVADAAGVLRGGNVAVLRIGRDALQTAKTLVSRAVRPALEAAGLPAAAIQLVDSPEHAVGWALFSDKRLALAVARGSGDATRTLGALARRTGIPVSLHGTGGAWLVAGQHARPEPLEEAVTGSLDRKVCNSLNTCCLQRSDVERLVPPLLRGLEAAGAALGQPFKLHVVRGDEGYLPAELFRREVVVARAHGEVREAQAELLDEHRLGTEWEWEKTPEVSLKVVDDVAQAAALFNRYSPRFVASLISDDAAEQDAFYRMVDAPFVGDAATRWVDGQLALRRPELGLSNWELGRLFGRGGILTGDDVFTVRTRARRR